MKKTIICIILILIIIGGSFLWVKAHDGIGFVGAVWAGIMLMGFLTIKSIK